MDSRLVKVRVTEVPVEHEVKMKDFGFEGDSKGRELRLRLSYGPPSSLSVSTLSPEV
jgi:hypothetical protein